jgi:hypothetical protein
LIVAMRRFFEARLSKQRQSRVLNRSTRFYLPVNSRLASNFKHARHARALFRQQCGDAGVLDASRIHHARSWLRAGAQCELLACHCVFINCAVLAIVPVTLTLRRYKSTSACCITIVHMSFGRSLSWLLRLLTLHACCQPDAAPRNLTITPRCAPSYLKTSLS